MTITGDPLVDKVVLGYWPDLPIGFVILGVIALAGIAYSIWNYDPDKDADE